MTIKQSENTGKLLKPEEVAKRLGVCKRQVYFLIDTGKLSKPLKVGRLNRWVESDITAYISQLSYERDTHSLSA